MESEQSGQCAACSVPLPSTARSTRKYCSSRCRLTHYRHRHAQTDVVPTARSALDQLKRENAQLLAANRRLEESKKRYKAQKRSLEGELVQRDKYIQHQAKRVADARGKASQMRIERNQARREADAADIDPTEHQRLKTDVAALTETYQQWKSRYFEIAEGLDGVAEEREFLKQIARSWDGMCQRLYKQLKRDPRTQRDRDTLELWVKFRKGVGRPVKPLVKETL